MEDKMFGERMKRKMEGCAPNLEGDGEVRVRPKGRLWEDTERVRNMIGDWQQDKWQWLAPLKDQLPKNLIITVI